MITYNDYWLAHHGILGQKWGVRNGPPYPLGSDVSTGKRLKSGSAGATMAPSDKAFKKSLDKDLARFTFANKHIQKSTPVKIDGIKIKSKDYSIFDDIRAVNPNFDINKDDSYSNNCRYCTMTYDLRCRGYDVQAKARGSNKDYMENAGYGALSKVYFPPPSEDRWTGIQDGDGREISNKPTRKQAKKLQDMAKYQFDKLPKNCRGELAMTFWFDHDSGHSVAFEKVNGTLIIADTQMGGPFNLDTYYQFTDRRVSAFMINRLDNLDFYPDQIKRFCK